MYAQHMEQILLTTFKQFLVFTKCLNSLTLFNCSSGVHDQLPKAHIINGLFVTDDSDLTFIVFTAFIACFC